MGSSRFLRKEGSGGFANEGGSFISPRNVFGVFFGGDENFFSVDKKGVSLSLFDLEGESSVDGIVFKLVNHIVNTHERIVDGNEFSLVGLERCSGDESSNSSESVDTESD